MSLQTNITALVTAIGTDIKTLTTKQGDLTALNTTTKTSLVAAINELEAEIGGFAGGAAINDTAGDGVTTQTWSANKIFDELVALRSSILGGASAAYDTLLELETKFGEEATATANMLTAIGNRVRFDAAQTLDSAQKAQARTNIDAASGTDLTTLTTNIGDTSRNFVTDYTTAKA